MRKVVALTILLLVLGSSMQAVALEAGGELTVDYDGQLRESLELELFLPPVGSTEARYAFVLNRPVQDLLAGEEVSYFAKKLYLKHHFPGFYVTVGRQPISWAFGSLLNPADYTLGSVALGEEYDSKYTDALEVYIPVNWNSGLSLITSFPEGFSADSEKAKWGARARMGVGGYDLTINYVREAQMGAPAFPGQRLGLTLKGDLGDFGVYGAYAHQFDEGIESSNSYLAGADYSFNLDYDTKITLQAEYVRSELGDQDLVVGSLGYPIDEFSLASLVTTINMDDGSTVFIPRYQTTLPGGVDLAISGTFAAGQDPGGLLSISYPF